MRHTQPLREGIYARLLSRLVSHKIRPRTRLHDFVLARELGYSRTPVREALLRLREEGFLESAARRGFLVRPLSVSEAEEIYPIIAALEALALRSFDIRGVDAQKLKGLNRAMRSSENAVERSELDMAFHEALLEPCKNSRLLEILGKQKQVVRRYEIAYMKEVPLVRSSGVEHEKIIQSVQSGNRQQAIAALDVHWQSSMYSLLRFLRAQQM